MFKPGWLLLIGNTKYLSTCVAEITRPVTSNLTSLYDQILNSTVTAAYQHGERPTLACCFNENPFLYILTLVFLCPIVSDEAETQATFSWTCRTASPESRGRRPPRPRLKVGGKHIPAFQVCVHYWHPCMLFKSWADMMLMVLFYALGLSPKCVRREIQSDKQVPQPSDEPPQVGKYTHACKYTRIHTISMDS